MSDLALHRLRRKLDREEAKRLSRFAVLSTRAHRRRPDPLVDEGHRQEFAVDADRVLHSLAYTRYIDKTQVFSLVGNAHISHRVLHVQLVSKIGRTVGRLLQLNEDLIEAASLAHDLGHPPFGHDGERFLSNKCLEHGLGYFQHNVQSYRALERIEKGGRGLNLTQEVLDAVLCHDGEVHSDSLSPRRDKTFEDLDREAAQRERDPKLPLIPMSLEGCVVRLVDTVAYVGRDLEDAILLGLVEREDIPAEVVPVLGNTNGTIVYRLVEDMVEQSAGKDLIGFSPKVGRALKKLKEFNLHSIYTNPLIKSEHGKIETAYHRLFDRFLKDLERDNTGSPVFTDFLDHMDPVYREACRPAEAVRDFLAGMTDDYFLASLTDLTLPRRLPPRLKGLGPLS